MNTQNREIDQNELDHAKLLAERNVLWDDLPLSEKAKLVSYWHIVIFVANILQIISGLMTMFIFSFEVKSIYLIIGISCFLTWASFAKYVEYDPEFSFITRSMQLASGTIGKHILFCLPIMIGLAFFGMAIFYQLFRF